MRGEAYEKMRKLLNVSEYEIEKVCAYYNGYLLNIRCNSNRNSFNPLLYRCFRVLRVDGFHGFRYNLMVYYKEE